MISLLRQRFKEMDKMDEKTYFDKDKIAPGHADHFIPNKDIKSAEHCKMCAAVLPASMTLQIILTWRYGN